MRLSHLTLLMLLLSVSSSSFCALNHDQIKTALTRPASSAGRNPSRLAFKRKPAVAERFVASEAARQGGGAALPILRLPSQMGTTPVPGNTAYAMLAGVMPKSPYVAMRLPGSPVLKSGITNERTIDLTVGKARIINLPFAMARVAISEPGTAQAIVISPTQLQLVGKQPGLTSLTLWSSPYDTQPLMFELAVSRDVSQLAKQLKKIDPNINITPMPADNSVVLTGEVESAETAQVAMELARVYFKRQGNGTGNGSGGASAATAASTADTLNSQAPGSTITAQALPNVVNLLKVKGMPSSKMALVQDKLKAIDPNILMDVVPGPDGKEKVILSGRVKSASVISRAINIASIVYGQPGLKVLTGPGGNSVRATGGGQFQTAENFSDNMDTNILQGNVVTDASGNVVSMMQVQEKPQIKCVIKFLDVSRRDLNQLGASFSGSSRNFGGTSLSGLQSALRNIADINGDASGAAHSANRGSGGNGFSNNGALTQTFRQGVTQVFTINQGLTAALSAFIEKRNIKSLAEPTLTTLSGEKASFLAGGEIPVPVSGNQGQISVSFKEFGIRLNLIPTVTEDGRIHMQIAPEVSEVDPSVSIVANSISIPGFRKRRMQTTLELDNKQAFVMAGLFNKTSIDTLSKLPGAGSVPVLGALFRQKNGEKSDNEMVVIIQPEIVLPAVAEAKP